MKAELNSRERVLRLFRKEEIDRMPIFSGLGNITVDGLKKCGYRFVDVHQDARKMASAAATTFQLFGFECATVPFDFGIEPEILGCEVNFYPHYDEQVIYPTIKRNLAEHIEDVNIAVPSDFAKAGRIPVVTEAIRLLKEEVGREVAVGAIILGPYTLAGQVTDPGHMAKVAFKKPEVVHRLLDILDEVEIKTARIYKEAGADYITIHEMAAGGEILSPRMFGSLVRPHLERIITALPSPRILHMCGDTDAIVDQMAMCGADAISVEQKNHIAESRQKVGPDVILLGNIDTVNLMVRGKPEEVESAVKQVIADGVNAVWPGCDLWPTVPQENMKALVAATIKYGKLG
jgi:[methyl-Co(III) methanol-specific corrinoid protein]:coenzyme M methyltransferase